MAMPSRVYLVSKTFDPFLGIFSGVWAYYIYEKRLQRPEGHSLVELVQWKWGETRNRNKDGAADDDKEGWEELDQEVKKLQQKSL